MRFKLLAVLALSLSSLSALALTGDCCKSGAKCCQASCCGASCCHPGSSCCAGDCCARK